MNIYAFKLKEVQKIIENKDSYQIDFSIESALKGNFKLYNLSILLQKESESIKLNFDKNINKDFKNFFKESLTNLKYLNVKKVNFFEENINKTSISFNQFDRDFDSSINWGFVRPLNEMDLPYSNGIKLGVYADSNHLKFLIQQYLFKVESKQFNADFEKNIAIINLNMYLESLIINRVLNLFLYTQNIYLLEVISKENGLSPFDKIKNSHELIINGKKVYIEISTELNKQVELNLIIKVKVNDKHFILTDKNHNLSMNLITDLLSYIYEEEIILKKMKKKDLTLSEIKNVFAIINDIKKDNDHISYEPLNSFYNECKGFVFDIHNMEITEVFSVNEVNSLIFEKIKQILM